jgi:integrase
VNGKKMASIDKRGDGQWRARIRRKGYPEQTNTFDIREDAEKWARAVEREMDTGHFLNRTLSEQVLMGELFCRYREDILPTKHGRHFIPSLRRLEEVFSSYALSALTSALVANYRDNRLKNGRIRKKGTNSEAKPASLSASTVRKEINLLSTIIDLAIKEWGYPMSINPCTLVSRPSVNDARDRRLSAEEEVALFNASSPQMRAIAQFAVETAGRLGEILRLNWRDVDLKKHIATFRDTKENKNSEFVSDRTIPLSSRAIAVLETVKKLPSSLEGRVFWWWKAPDSFNKSWRRTCTRAKIQNLHFHDLRHEATSRFFELGTLETMEVATITGHRTLQTLKRYTHLQATKLVSKLG